jgi:hypothetical protein
MVACCFPVHFLVLVVKPANMHCIWKLECRICTISCRLFICYGLSIFSHETVEVSEKHRRFGILTKICKSLFFETTDGCTGPSLQTLERNRHVLALYLPFLITRKNAFLLRLIMGPFRGFNTLPGFHAYVWHHLQYNWAPLCRRCGILRAFSTKLLFFGLMRHSFLLIISDHAESTHTSTTKKHGGFVDNLWIV